MRSEKAIPVPHELFNGETDGFVASAEQVKDYRFDKSQEEINRTLIDELETQGSKISEVRRDIGALESINASDRLDKAEKEIKNNTDKINDINSVVHAEFDDIPTKGSTKFVNSGAVYDAIHSSLINVININQLDTLISSDLYKPNTPTRYTVITPFAHNNYKIGNLIVMADDEGHKLMQIFVTSLAYNDNDGTLNVDSYSNPIVYIYRTFNYLAYSTDPNSAGWTRWYYVNKDIVEGNLKFDREQSLSFRNIARVLSNIGLAIYSEINDSNLQNDTVNGVIPAIPYRIPTLKAVYDFVKNNGVPKLPLSEIDNLGTKEYTTSDKPSIYKVYDLNTNRTEMNVGVLILFSDTMNNNLIQLFISSYKIVTNNNTQQLSVDDENIDVTIIYRHRKLTNGTVTRVDWSDWKVFGEDIFGNTIKYNQIQNLNETQKETARKNIGITIDDDDSTNEAVFLDPESVGLPTSRYVNKALEAIKNILNHNITDIHNDSAQNIKNVRTELITKCNELYETFNQKITELYINNGIRIFDGFIPANRRPVINSSVVSDAVDGEVLWYPAGKTFLYRGATGGTSDNPIYTLFANWTNKHLYLDNNNLPYDSVIYINGSSNYRVVDGELVLIEDSSAISARLAEVNQAIADTITQLNDLQNQVTSGTEKIEDISYGELVELIQLNSLKPGKKYRIIDYCSWFNKASLGMGGHLFDLIVEAISEYELNPQATVVPTKYRNDTYFIENNVNVSDFKVWYNPMAVRSDIEKYADQIGYDGNDANMIIIINTTKEVFYCNSLEDNKLHYIGTDNKVLSPYDFARSPKMEDYKGRYAEFLANPNSINFRPDKKGSVLYVYRVESLDDIDDPTKYVETTYKANQITVLRPTGFIYKMIDDNNNEACYDFKNLLYKLYKYGTNDARIDDITNESVRADIESESENCNIIMQTMYGFKNILSVAGDDTDNIKRHYPITEEHSFFYPFTILPASSTSINRDFTVVNFQRFEKPKDNKIGWRNVIVITPTFNHSIINNKIYADRVILRGSKELNNITIMLDDIIVCSTGSDNVKNEIISEVANHSTNGVMIHSNEYYKHKKLINYINSL